mgnify:CR=1 FL=1
MEEDAIERIRASWARAAASPEILTGLFYGRLFRIAPETRGLFRVDMAMQGRKLADTLGFVVDNLEDPDRLTPEVRALAERHVGYGAVSADYAAVGEALIWALEQALGPAFEAQTRAAWADAYATLSAAMIAAAEAKGGARTRAPA